MVDTLYRLRLTISLNWLSRIATIFSRYMSCMASRPSRAIAITTVNIHIVDLFMRMMMLLRIVF